MSQPINVLTDERLQVAATSLAEARSPRQPGPRVSERFALANLNEAYQAQGLGTSIAVAQGRFLSGAKAGLTSAALRAALKVAEPLYGRLFADTACKEGSSIPWERLLQPKVEIELALVLAHDLPNADIAQQQLLASLAGVVPAFEINDSAIDGWQITLLDAVADNLSAGLYVLGARMLPLSQLQGATLSADVHKNSESVHNGLAVSLSDCLDTALWLARKMVDIGQPLRAGDVLLTGALAPMLAVERGDHLHFSVEGLGEELLRAGMRKAI